ncbi:hypothetical protein R1sor_015917 [Riccia sorocarpa]|uniref:Uncharacterized protein n=1 Tax=Riccia sorocarpa TaxID=122646 RepID=A0ABD3HDW7_9MARC
MDSHDVHAAILVERLRDASILPDEVIHDGKCSFDAISRRFGIVSQKDLLHKCKNVLKKFLLEVEQKRQGAMTTEEAQSRADLAELTKKTLEGWLRSHQIEGNKDELVEQVASLKGFASIGDTLRPTAIRSPFMYLELSRHGIADKLKSWKYTCCC